MVIKILVGALFLTMLILMIGAIGKIAIYFNTNILELFIGGGTFLIGIYICHGIGGNILDAFKSND